MMHRINFVRGIAMPTSSFNPMLAFCPWMALFTDVEKPTSSHAAPRGSLSHSVWRLGGVDSDGTDWAGSQITFVSQRPLDSSGQRFSISGVIDWESHLGETARELFLGELRGNHLRLEGFELRTESPDFVLGTYDAELSDDGSALRSGRWIGDNNAADTERWEATLVSREEPDEANATATASNGSGAPHSAIGMPAFALPGFDPSADAFGFDIAAWQWSLSLPISMFALSALMFEQTQQAWLALFAQFPGLETP